MILAALAVIIIIVVAIKRNVSRGITPRTFEPEVKRAGHHGERIAANIIKSVLYEDDYCFTNVAIHYQDKKAELDNVIVNKYGVFIIEVKNYKGRLYGAEDDYDWKKYKDDGYGNTFEKEVKNPIKQVKRQIYILAKCLECYGTRVWVDGYALLVNGNSPVKSSYVLENLNDIDTAIHTFRRERLSDQNVESIVNMLRYYQDAPADDLRKITGQFT